MPAPSTCMSVFLLALLPGRPEVEITRTGSLAPWPQLSSQRLTVGASVAAVFAQFAQGR